MEPLPNEKTYTILTFLTPHTILQRLGELFFTTQDPVMALALAQEMRQWSSDLLSTLNGGIEIKIKERFDP